MAKKHIYGEGLLAKLRVAPPRCEKKRSSNTKATVNLHFHMTPPIPEGEFQLDTVVSLLKH